MHKDSLFLALEQYWYRDHFYEHTTLHKICFSSVLYISNIQVFAILLQTRSNRNIFYEITIFFIFNYLSEQVVQHFRLSSYNLTCHDHGTLSVVIIENRE